MQAKTIKLSDLHLNTGQIKDVPKNPRFIKDERFNALKKSIEDSPEMLQLRELVAYDNNGELVVIMGNMRYRAMKDLGFKDAPVKILPQDTPAEKLRAYIIKDNVAFGQNDWDLMGNEWDTDELQDFGLECDFLGEEDMPTDEKQDESNYTQKIQIPTYEIKGEEPQIEELVDTDALDNLIDEIEASNVSEAQKNMLKICAYRHAKINFEKMAEYYAHQDKEMQELMENNALVIIDFNKAVERGFVDMTNKLLDLLPEENKAAISNDIDYDEE